LGLGDEFREALVSEINCPAAEGGSFAGVGAGEMPRDLGVAAPDDAPVFGFWTTFAISGRPKTLVFVALLFEFPAM
jgi:hypothetical protein